MKRALSSYRALHRREGHCSTAVGGKQWLSAQRRPQDGHEKPPLNRSDNVTSLVTSKGGHRYDHEPLDTIANRALQAQLRPQNRKTIVQEFSHQGGYLHWETHGVRTHTGCSIGDCTSPWHSRTGALPSKSYRIRGSGGRKRSETHFLSEKWGAETAPSSTLGQGLCTV